MSVGPRRINGLPRFIDHEGIRHSNIELLLVLIQQIIMLGLGFVYKLVRLIELVCLVLRAMQVQLRIAARRR